MPGKSKLTASRLRQLVSEGVCPIAFDTSCKFKATTIVPRLQWDRPASYRSAMLSDNGYARLLHRISLPLQDLENRVLAVPPPASARYSRSLGDEGDKAAAPVFEVTTIEAAGRDCGNERLGDPQ
jgi:hypothetical protein